MRKNKRKRRRRGRPVSVYSTLPSDSPVVTLRSVNTPRPPCLLNIATPTLQQSIMCIAIPQYVTEQRIENIVWYTLKPGQTRGLQLNLWAGATFLTKTDHPGYIRVNHCQEAITHDILHSTHSVHSAVLIIARYTFSPDN